MDRHYDYKIQILLGCLILLTTVWFSVHKNLVTKPQKTALIYESLNQTKPEIQAESYLVKIAGEDGYLLKQREWKKLAPASLTKLLTAVIAEETLNPFEKIIVSEEAKKVEAKTSPVERGELLTKDDLMKLLLSGSANDMALVLVEEIKRQYGSKNLENGLILFRRLAKDKTAELGMSDSSFQNPVGLDDPEHYTTAQDLVKLTEYILYKRSGLWDLSVILKTEVYAESGNRYLMSNTNILLKEFPSILGSKTGFTEKARDTLLILYPVRPDKIAIIIILKSENRVEDGRKILKWLDGVIIGQ